MKFISENNIKNIIFIILIGESYIPTFNNQNIFVNSVQLLKHKNTNNIVKYKRQENISNINDTTIYFNFYKDGELTYSYYHIDNIVMEQSKCRPSDKFAFILHGWKQNCETDWVLKLIDRLTFHRKGCIVCIDYRYYAKAPYIQLYRNFKKITDIMYLKLLSLINVGFNPSNGYMFGFSYGGQLATQIGAALKPHFTFYNIDTCDMAGPGFDLFNNFDHTIGAELVQCLHSSRDKGTAFYTCHQNVRLGKCGYTQAAVISQNRFSNHGLCVQIYINAFDYPFYAICNGQKLCGTTSAAVNIPRGYTIGYKENPNMNITGEIFVPTSANFPYNVQQEELLELSYC